MKKLSSKLVTCLLVPLVLTASVAGCSGRNNQDEVLDADLELEPLPEIAASDIGTPDMATGGMIGIPEGYVDAPLSPIPGAPIPGAPITGDQSYADANLVVIPPQVYDEPAGYSDCNRVPTGKADLVLFHQTCLN